MKSKWKMFDPSTAPKDKALIFYWPSITRDPVIGRWSSMDHGWQAGNYYCKRQHGPDGDRHLPKMYMVAPDIPTDEELSK